MTNTTEHYDRVKEFMRLAGQDTPEEATIPNEKIRRLRAKLILEEALETIVALGFNVWASGPNKSIRITDDRTHFAMIPNASGSNLEQLIDGCCDLSVVTIGTLIAFGIPDKPFLEEVDAANLRKFEPPKCPNCTITDREGKNYVYYLERLELWRCAVCKHEFPKEAGPYTRADGKHIKPPYWQPPDILGTLKHLEK